MKKNKAFPLNEKEAEAILCVLQTADLRLVGEDKQIVICENIRDRIDYFLEFGELK